MEDFEPKIAAFLCNWCAYAGADLAGVSRLQYPSNIRPIRVMCSGRVDPVFIVKALKEGCDGVLVAGWHFGDCHYLDGNVHAEKKILSTQKLFGLAGIGRERLYLAWVSSAEAQRFAEIAASVTASIKSLGKFDPSALAFALDAAEMTLDGEIVRWMVSKELTITSEGDIYGRKWDVERYESILDSVMEREYHKNLIFLAIKEGFTSVEDISDKTGLDLELISYLLVDLEKTGMVRFTGMTDRIPAFAALWGVDMGSEKGDTCGAIMVVGAGITGMQASLDAADSGYYVYLVEKSPSIGGMMSQLDKTFPTNDCAMWIISPKLVEVGRHVNIELITCSEVKSVEGDPGNFEVSLVNHPRYIDPAKCTGCGECAIYCPVTAVNPYNMGLDDRRATYIEYAQAVPLVFAIDTDTCIGCGKCETKCLAQAIKFDDKERETTINVGSIILSLGSKGFDPSDLEYLGYKKYTNVVTSQEFERILSASGPYSGHLMRPFDRREPEKIAWFQCIGSRDVSEGANAYCSSVCCMYAIKEAVIAKEHAESDLDCAIFYMDIRTPGKDFEKYYKDAKDKHDVRFIKSRVHTVEPVPGTGDLEVKYVTESGEVKTEIFDMIVLSVGLQTSPEVINLADRFGIELTEGNFCKTETFEPVTTSREGIFVCGAIQGPKDIPESVMEASAAACSAGIGLASARGTLVKKKEFPDEKDVTDAEPHVGVFVCNCGINIGGIADVPAIVEYAKGLPNVVYVEDNLFTCSQDTQDKMAEVIKEQNLNRIVVAACTPRTHEPLFQETLRNAGLNAYLFDMANIRNQCTWVHSDDKENATGKCKDLTRMAVARASLLEQIPDISVDVNKSALIIGGGIAGLTVALSLADQGFPATIVEKSSLLGGAARDLTKTWKGQDIQEYLSKLLDKIEQHSDIEVLLNAEVVGASGFVGNFETQVATGNETKTVEHGVTIIATGGKAADTDEYLYGKNPRVTRWHELENDPKKLKDAESIVFIQCVGSRDDNRPYCSRICCTASVMQAVSIKEKSPDTDVFILYRDMRTFGERESLYKQAREKGVIFIQYSLDNKPTVTESGDGLEVSVFDPILQKNLQIKADLVNLATAIEPAQNDKISEFYKIPLNAENFFMEAHAKLRPVEFATEGIFLCGLAHYPKSIEESISQAMAAASRAATILSKPSIAVSPLVSQVDTEKCIGCGLCDEICAFNAIILEDPDGKGYRAKNIPASCKGCGLCAASCPQQAIDMLHFGDQQIVASVCAAI